MGNSTTKKNLLLGAAGIPPVASLFKGSSNPKTPSAAEQGMTDYGTKMGDRSQTEYDYRTGTRGDITGKYWDLYNQAGEGADGGGGGYYDPSKDVRMNEAMGTAREFMNTGGWTPEQIASQKSYATAPISGMYEGLRRDLSTRAAGMGTPGAYTGSAARLGRDSAYQMSDAANRAGMDIESNIREGRLSGMGAVGGYDTEYMNRMKEAKDKANANARYASGAGGRSRDEQAGYLRALTGMYEGAEDLPYAGLEYDPLKTIYGGEKQEASEKKSNTGGYIKAGLGAAATVAAII